MLNVISLGAGVQSSTMAMMATHGEITPMPACAIFADTGDEPVAVYEWLNWLTARLPFPTLRVSIGTLSNKSVAIKITKDGKRSYLQHSVPVFVLNANGTKGMARRHCTRDFKLDPIRRQIRKLGASTKTPCTTWIGISTDEASRMKPSKDGAQKNRWPLIENNMSRAQCVIWMKSNGYPTPPRSACTYCPYHSDEHWLSMPEEELQAAFRYELALQGAYSKASELDGTPFLHSSLIPLPAALAKIRDHPRPPEQQDIFSNECEGMCGV